MGRVQTVPSDNMTRADGTQREAPIPRDEIEDSEDFRARFAAARAAAPRTRAGIPLIAGALPAPAREAALISALADIIEVVCVTQVPAQRQTPHKSKRRRSGLSD